MTITAAQYSNFETKVRLIAPRFPIQNESRLHRTRANAGRAVNTVNALSDGLGANVPGVVGAVTSLATANGVDDLTNSAVDTGISIGLTRAVSAAAGTVAGGGIMLVRGTAQCLDRGEAMVNYLHGTRGYVDTIARSCIIALCDDYSHAMLPTTQIPDFAHRGGSLYSSANQEAYIRGRAAARKLFKKLDDNGPSRGMRDSKLFLRHLISLTRFGGQQEPDHGQLRNACKDIIMRDILSIDINQQAEQLRQWSNAA